VTRLSALRGALRRRAPRALLGLGIAWLAAAPALAADDDEPDYARTGLYVGLAGDYALPDLNDLRDRLGHDLLQPTLVLFDQQGFGVHTRIGYRVHPRLALEVHHEWLTDRGGLLQGTSKDETFALTGDAKAFLLTGRAQPFVAAGFGWFHGDGSGLCGGVPAVRAQCANALRTGDAALVRVGGGVDIYVNENWVIGLDATYVMPQGRFSDFNWISIGWGLDYRF
jgi:opacity protein-like surface antigen